MASNKSVFDRLKALFGITVGQKALKGRDNIVVPGEYDKKSNKVRAVPMSSENQKLLDFWMRDVFDTPDSLKARLDRYKDLDYAYYNSTIVSMAIDLYADETVQADSQSQILQVTAKNPKVERYINDFFEKIGITQKLIRNVAFDVSLYGDHFWVNVTKGDEGITKIIPIDVYSVTERMEFNAVDVNKRMKERGFQGFEDKTDSRAAKLNKIFKSYSDSTEGEDFSSFFKTFLFGYVIIDNMYMPPWNVTHFRRFATKSEFFPYGRPVLINSISPFKQLQTAKNLMALARANKFPKESFGIDTAETMTQSSKWEAVNEARQEYENLGLDPTNKDQFAVGGQIWYPNDILTYDIKENNLSMDDIADVELLRDDLIMGTRVPKGYLIVDQASFGTSGQALLQQFKPFGRAVYSIQSVIMEELSNLVRLQFVMTGEYEMDEEFELTMSFPVVEESADRTRAKGDSFGLAKDILDGVAGIVGLETSEMPPEVIKDILSSFSFLSREDIDEWITQAIKKKESNPETEDQQTSDVVIPDSGTDSTTQDSTDDNYWERYRRTSRRISPEKLRERISRINKDIIREQYFKSKKKLRMAEGVSNRRHFFTSMDMDTPTKEYLQMIKEVYQGENDTIRG